MGNSMAYEVGKLMARNIYPAFVECSSSNRGTFRTIYSCLRTRSCDVSLPVMIRQPFMEELVDFTCPVRDANLFVVYSTDTISTYDEVTSDDSICTTEGIDYVQALTNYPDSPKVFYANATAMWHGFCNGDCDYVVDSLNEGLGLHELVCPSTDITYAFLPFWTTGGDQGAITYKSSGVEKYSY
jgi:hypothetical protein